MMRILHCEKEGQVYDLTYSMQDAQYEKDRRELILAGWDIDERVSCSTCGSHPRGTISAKVCRGMNP